MLIFGKFRPGMMCFGAILAGLVSTGTSAMAGDACCAPAPACCAPAPTCYNCADCDKIFQETGDKLSQHLAKFSCCAPSCGAPEGCGSCGNGCGSGCGCGDHGCLGGLCCGELGDPWTLASHMADPCGCPCPITIGGWTQFGYTNNIDGTFNTHPHNVNLHQQWFYVEKLADGTCGLDWGFRADLVYGVDAQNTQAFGNNPGAFDFQNGWDHGIYGWAMPQLYAEVATGDLNVKLGHFFTPLGYEVVPATGNFFYSHAFTMNFSEPFTHTGVLGTYQLTDATKVYAGWTAGWDTGFDQRNDGSNFIGGVSEKVGENLTLTYLFTAGNLGWIGDDGYSHSIVADYVINDKWEYVFQSDYIDSNGVIGAATPYETVGINNYLFYTVCDKVKVGGRAEWWKAQGESYYEVTAGVNYFATANFRIRPEYRYQWAPGQTDANPFAIPLNQSILGIDAILTF